jgi:hypothetical protein
VGATLIAAAVVVLVIGMGWLSRGGEPDEQLAMPVVDGVTQATDADGHAVEVPPSQPAVAVSFAADGQILRPDPVRARVVDESGAEIIVPLAPNTTVDTVTGQIVPLPPGTTTRPGTSPTTRPTTTPTSPPTVLTTPPTTAPPTTPTTEPPPTTTEPPPTTTEPPPTTEDTTPPADPGVLGSILDDLLP